MMILLLFGWRNCFICRFFEKEMESLVLDREEEYCDLASVYFRARRRKQWASCHAPDDLLLRSSVGAAVSAVAGQSPAGHRKQTAAAQQLIYFYFLLLLFGLYFYIEEPERRRTTTSDELVDAVVWFFFFSLLFVSFDLKATAARWPNQRSGGPTSLMVIPACCWVPFLTESRSFARLLLEKLKEREKKNEL